MDSSSRRSDLSSRSRCGGAERHASSSRDRDTPTWYFLTTPPLWFGEDETGKETRDPDFAGGREPHHSLRRSRISRRALLGALGAGLSAPMLGDAWSRATSRRAGRASGAPGAAPGGRPLKYEAEFAVWFASLRLRYLLPSEVIRPHRNVRGGIANDLPPRRQWSRLEPALRVADEIRHRLGRPILCVNSAYRSPAYNAVCAGAASRSYHMENRALDLVFHGGPADAAGVARALRDEGFFRGGIGTYKGFIHIDTRGRNATWEG